jgi:hypothetical protein
MDRRYQVARPPLDPGGGTTISRASIVQYKNLRRLHVLDRRLWRRHPARCECISKAVIRCMIVSIRTVATLQKRSHFVPEMYGLMSSTGVSSSKSTPDRYTVRLRISTRSILASVMPMGLGLCGDRVQKMPTRSFSMGGEIFA